MTKGQHFAKSMRKNFAIGTRTRRFTSKKIGGWDMHKAILEAITTANQYPGYYTEERQTLFRSAWGAWMSYNKHIAGYRADCKVIAYVNALSPWQFCNLLGRMVDAEITNVGEGERFFEQLRAEIYAQAA